MVTKAELAGRSSADILAMVGKSTSKADLEMGLQALTKTKTTLEDLRTTNPTLFVATHQTELDSAIDNIAKLQEQLDFVEGKITHTQIDKAFPDASQASIAHGLLNKNTQLETDLTAALKRIEELEKGGGKSKKTSKDKDNSVANPELAAKLGYDDEWHAWTPVTNRTVRWWKSAARRLSRTVENIPGVKKSFDEDKIEARKVLTNDVLHPIDFGRGPLERLGIYSERRLRQAIERMASAKDGIDSLSVDDRSDLRVIAQIYTYFAPGVGELIPQLSADKLTDIEKEKLQRAMDSIAKNVNATERGLLEKYFQDNEVFKLAFITSETRVAGAPPTTTDVDKLKNAVTDASLKQLLADVTDTSKDLKTLDKTALTGLLRFVASDDGGKRVTEPRDLTGSDDAFNKYKAAFNGMTDKSALTSWLSANEARLKEALAIIDAAVVAKLEKTRRDAEIAKLAAEYKKVKAEVAALPTPLEAKDFHPSHHDEFLESAQTQLAIVLNGSSSTSDFDRLMNVLANNSYKMFNQIVREALITQAVDATQIKPELDAALKVLEAKP